MCISLFSNISWRLISAKNKLLMRFALLGVYVVLSHLGCTMRSFQNESANRFLDSVNPFDRVILGLTKTASFVKSAINWPLISAKYKLLMCFALLGVYVVLSHLAYSIRSFQNESAKYFLDTVNPFD